MQKTHRSDDIFQPVGQKDLHHLLLDLLDQPGTHDFFAVEGDVKNVDASIAFDRYFGMMHLDAHIGKNFSDLEQHANVVTRFDSNLRERRFKSIVHFDLWDDGR